MVYWGSDWYTLLFPPQTCSACAMVSAMQCGKHRSSSFSTMRMHLFWCMCFHTLLMILCLKPLILCMAAMVMMSVSDIGRDKIVTVHHVGNLVHDDIGGYVSQIIGTYYDVGIDQFFMCDVHPD